MPGRGFTTIFIVGLYELAVACEELLDWDLQKTIGLLQGLSDSSTASTDELASLARRAGQRIATRELLEARTPDILKRTWAPRAGASDQPRPPLDDGA